jgi:hypothetical protein
MSRGLLCECQEKPEYDSHPHFGAVANQHLCGGAPKWFPQEARVGYNLYPADSTTAHVNGHPSVELKIR